MPISQQQIENQKKLVAALRSGEYKQAINALRPNGGDKFCCLGVACDISELGRWDDDESYSVYMIEDDDSEERDESRLLPSVRDYYGWQSVDGVVNIFRHIKDNGKNHDGMTLISLLELNDDGFTFDQIADIIEARLVQEIE